MISANGARKIIEACNELEILKAEALDWAEFNIDVKIREAAERKEHRIIIPIPRKYDKHIMSMLKEYGYHIASIGLTDNNERRVVIDW